MAMIALRVVLASFVSVMALAPALASDNSKSHLDPDIHVYGRADQMSTSDPQVASAPNPTDSNYITELQTQLFLQQQQVQAAQAALASAQAALAAALQLQALEDQQSNTAVSLLQAAKNNVANPAGSAALVALIRSALDVAIHGQAIDSQQGDNAFNIMQAAQASFAASQLNNNSGAGSASVLAQAQIAFNATVEAFSSGSHAEGNMASNGMPLSWGSGSDPSVIQSNIANLSGAMNALNEAAADQTAGYSNAATFAAQQAFNDIVTAFAGGSAILGQDGMPTSWGGGLGGNFISDEVANLTQAVAADQIVLARAQAAVAQTQAQINAAQNGQSPPGQTSDTNNQTANNTDTTDLSDPSIMANAAIDGGGQADSGGADGGD
jgi:hypothetical protein